MKYPIITLIALTLGLSILFPVSAQQQQKKTIAVLNFVNSGGVGKDEISILTDRFNNYLVNTNVYKVLEREKMDAILKEQDFTMTDNCNSAECAVQIGQLLGMDLMIAGKIGKFGAVYTLDIRIIDVSTGEILRTKSENYKGEKEGLLDMVEGLAYTIAGLTAPAKKTVTTSGKITSDDISDEIKIGDVIKKYGSLEIECLMDGTLYIDNKLIGEVFNGSTIPIEKLKVGAHIIKIDNPFGEFMEKVIIENNLKVILAAGINIFKDHRDGKLYKTVKIGNQVWMAENLNYDAGNGSWCYADSSSNCEKYGRLYDWETAKNAATKGWHLPSKSELDTLYNYLGGTYKNVYQQIIPDGSSGFNVIFGGWRHNSYAYNIDGNYTYFWASTEDGSSRAYFLSINSHHQGVSMGVANRSMAFSVRLIKD